MVKRYLFSHFTPFVVLLWGGAMLPLAVVSAEVPLKQAVIQSLQNTVELSLQDQAPRPARVRDILSPGESLSTARAALAELRFDDGSLARIGGQAFVRFASKSRTFQLSNGTMLLLVPPERGQTRIQTPNAVASVRGSALFVRYVPETNSTLVGALTSDVEITNSDRSQAQMLGAGQLAIVTNNRLEPAYRFDLKTFYETSALAKGLDLQHLLVGQRSETADSAIEAVRAETADAIQKQTPLCTVNGVPNTQTVTPALRQSKPATTAGCRPASTAQAAPTTGQSDTSLAQPTSIDPPGTALLTAPTVALPATIPPTLALPTTMPLVNPPTAIVPPSPAAPTVPLPLERPPLPNPNLPNPNPPEPNLPNPNLPNPNLPNPNPPDPTVSNNANPEP